VGIEIAKAAYIVTRAFPREEMFTLTSQIRRAAASIPANIAEGHGRESTGDFVRFLRMSQGSLKELETHLYIAESVGIVAESALVDVRDLCDREGRMLRALIRSLGAEGGRE
jgi:four helix bundle protein